MRTLFHPIALPVIRDRARPTIKRLSTILFSASVALSGVALCADASAQANYPTHPIRLIIGFPPGGGADAVARIMAERLTRELGQTIIVDNKPGAGTTIASETAARAAPDGYTLYMSSSNIYGQDKVLYTSIKYDGVTDFTAIGGWSNAPLVLATNKELGVKTVGELIAKAKQNPGKLNYSSSGNGNVIHLASLLFMKETGTDMVHVPFKGGAPSVQAVVAGDVQLTFGTPPSVLPMIQAGRLDGIAVTSLKPMSIIPGLPSIAESGVPGFDYTFWYGLFGPAKLPPAIVKRLFDATNIALSDPEVVKKMAASGNEPLISSSPAQFREFAIVEGKKMKELTERSGAKID